MGTGTGNAHRSRPMGLLVGLCTALMLSLGTSSGHAAPPFIDYQGRVLGGDGNPLAGPVDIDIGVFDAATGGTELFHESHLATPLVDGVYSILIGGGTSPVGSFDATTFAADGRWLEMVINGETLSPRQPFASVAYAFQAEEATHAATAGDADTVDGLQAAALDQSAALAAHTGDTSNPHSVAAAQVGAITAAELATHAGDPSAHHARYADAEAVNAIKASDGAGSGLDADLLDGNHASAFATAGHNHDAAYYTKAYVDALEARIASLEMLLQHFSRAGNDITIAGANLHIVSGSGSTNGAVNGLGNVIIGYNEVRGSGDDRSGSHNLVVGRGHNYTSFAGIVTGYRNTISGAYASVSGGDNNTASGTYASVSGGSTNTASGTESSVSGGRANTAGATYATVSGGSTNVANAMYASVSGGYGNGANATYASVSGGSGNAASGDSASVSGGRFNIASGDYSSVAGGGGPVGADGNEAFGDYTTIGGGRTNLAGDAARVDHALGHASTVTGGYENVASGPYGSVSGGQSNIAQGYYASVTGGLGNDVSGTYASLSGGQANSATGYAAAVSGGRENIASGNWSSVVGGGGSEASYGNEAFAHYSVISGGRANLAGDPAKVDHNLGERALVSGGRDNTASGLSASVNGGASNTASQNYATVSGGYFNTASGYYASVSGGGSNTASGSHSSVSGGSHNTASGSDATASGGAYNDASTSSASVCGGYSNTASGDYATVSGGEDNTASGRSASVSGGWSHSATGLYDWRAGSLFETQ